MTSLRKYFWQLLTTILTLLTIFAAYNIFFLGQPKKELLILIDSPVSLVDVKPEAVQDIQVLYKGEPVNKIFLLQVQIKNSGNQPIAETDYSRPISFLFSSEYKLASATATSSHPENIGMTVTKVTEQEARVSTTLLNQGDIVFIKFIVIGDNSDALLSKLSFDGRIIGIKKIDRILTSEQQKPQDWLVWLGITIALIAQVFSIIASDKLWSVIRKLVKRKKPTQQSDNNRNTGAGYR
jgi:hypothetical protein